MAGLRTLAEQAHARGLTVVGATLMPFEGHRGYAQREAVRQRGQRADPAGSVFDAYVDFDKALRDPVRPAPAARRLRLRRPSAPERQGYGRWRERST